MSLANQKKLIQRILVAVDASPQSLAALEAAIELASKMEAELIGIFVEDINLLRVSGFPFAREVSYITPTKREIDSPHIEMQLRAQARRVEHILSNMAEQAHLRWSFRTVRGHISAELLAASLDTDIIIMGKKGWSSGKQAGSTTRVMVVKSPHQTMVLERSVRHGYPVMVAYENSPAGKKALSAINLVWDKTSLVCVLILADEAEEARELRLEAQAWLEENGISAHFNWLPEADGEKLARQTRTQSCGVLILPADSEHLPSDTLLDLVNNSECAILLVR